MKTATFAAVTLTVSLLSTSGAGAQDEASRIAEGRQLAEVLCAVCHLTGNASEKAAATQVPSFRAVARRPGQTLDGIVAWLASVPPMMPNHHLTWDERDKLAAYILSLR